MNNLVRLVPIQHSDTNLIVKWRNNPRVRNCFVFQEQFTVEMHENWLNTKVDSGEVIQFIVRTIDANVPIEEDGSSDDFKEYEEGSHGE